MQSQTPLVSKIVQAGAGTGKTESLAREVVRVAQTIWESKNSNPQIVATTFTEQATVELRQRVIEVAEKQNIEWLKAYVRNTESLQISTIHGVFAKILHRYGPLIGLDPEFTVISEEDEKKIIRKKLRGLMVNDEDVHFITDQYGFENSVHMLVQLMSHIHLYGEESNRQVSWEDVVKPQVDALLRNLSLIVSADTAGLSPALAGVVEILKRLQGQVSRVSRDFEKVRDLLLSSLEGQRKPSFKAKGLEYKQVVHEIFELKNQWVEETYSARVNAKHEHVVKLLHKAAVQLLQDVQAQKIQSGKLSFSDLELLTRDLLRQKPEVKTQIQSYFDYWFVDEFQDTSPLQKEILYSFFKKNLNVYFVGDPQQSIYLFRGADKNVFEEAKQKITQQNGELSHLKVNYRSSGDIIKFLNLLFQPLEPREEARGSVATEILLHGKQVGQDYAVLSGIRSFLMSGFSCQDIGILVRTNKDAQHIAQVLLKQGLPVFVHTSGGFYDRREVIDALSLLDFILDPHQDDRFVLLARSPWLHISDEQLVKWGQALRKMPRQNKISFWKHISDVELENVKILKNILNLKDQMPISFVFETALTQLGFFEFSAHGDLSGKREANLRKLLSDLRAAETMAGFNAFEFVQKAWLDAEKLGEEKEALSFIEPDKINIMTIHKSKGLKFECVMVLDCGKAPRQRPKALELAANGVWATQVLSDDSEEKISPLALAFLKEQRWESESHEFMRLFYVATTRAAARLMLVANREIHPLSWLGQIQTKLNLNEGIHQKCYEVKFLEQEVPFESGDFKLPLTAGNVGMFKKNKIPTVFDSISLTPTEKTKKINLNDIIKNQVFGTEMHAVFEFINKHSEISPEVALEMAFNIKNYKIDKSKIAQMLNTKQLPLLEIIKKGFSEWAFSFKHNEKIYSGRIDLWCELDAKGQKSIYVIDFKSGDDERAQAQLEFYAIALKKAGCDWNKIKAVIIKPLKDEVKFISLSNYEDALASLDLHYRDHQLDQISKPH